MNLLKFLLAPLRILLSPWLSQQNINYGGDQNVINQPRNVHIYSSSSSPRPRNEQILLKAVKAEVNSRLAQSLHKAVLLNLGKEAQPQQVKRPWESEIKIGAKAAQVIPNDVTIAQLFESSEIEGKLLILGQPGAGKTTTLLDLAAVLVEKAEEDNNYPLPVLFNLSSWKDEGQLIRDWMVVELKSKYGVSPKLGKRWIKERVLLPLLDGLDEVAPERQLPCVHQINAYLTGESTPLYGVVCSRIAEYENYQAPLQLNGAVYLKALGDEQIEEYLIKVGREELWQWMRQSPQLLEFVRAPLLLSVAVLAYPNGQTEQWQELQRADEPLKFLLDRYVERMLHRHLDSRCYGKHQPPTARQTRGWLIWLAHQLVQESKTEFLIEKMQPSCLVERGDKCFYRVLVGGIFGIYGGSIITIITGLILSTYIEFSYALIVAFSTGSIFGLSFGTWAFFTIGHFQEIQPVENIKVLPLSMIKSIIGGLIAGLVTWQLSKVIVFIVVGIIIGIVFGIEKPSVEDAKYPNQGIWSSLKNSIYFSIFSGLILSCTSLILRLEISTLLFGQFKSLPLILLILSGVILGGFFGLILAGTAVIQHLSLRIVLTIRKHCPWNYARFFNYCTELLLLQRVGGRYQFIHGLLKEYFWEISLERVEIRRKL